MNLYNTKSYKDVEKFQLIQHLKNEYKLKKNENFKIDNVDLLKDVMNFVEMYYSKKGSGIIKEEVVRKVLDFFSENFLNMMIPFIVFEGLLKPKTIYRKIRNYVKKKNLQKKLKRTL